MTNTQPSMRRADGIWRLPSALVAFVLMAPHASGELAAQQSFGQSPDWVVPFLFNGEHGASMAGAGDVDGDGDEDLLISAPFYYGECCPSTNQEGFVLLYSGGASGLSNPTWGEIGPQIGTTLGWRVTADDFNGDGRGDLLFDSGSGFGGGTHALHVRFGGPAGPQTAWNFDTGQYFGALGPPLAAGDVNGDGHADVIAGFPRSDGERGRLRAFHGGALGLPGTPDWQETGDVGQQLGLGLAVAGDVDADGRDDVVVCDRFRNYRLYLGSATGLGAPAPWSYTGTTGDGCHLDRAFGAAGDVNGDGYADLAIGSPDHQHSGGEGAVHLFFGGPGGLGSSPQVVLGQHELGRALVALGDINADGFDDLAVAADLARVLLGSAMGLQPFAAWSGGTHGSIAAADVNGDGLIDLVTGQGDFSGESGTITAHYGRSAPASGPAADIGTSLRLARHGAAVVLGWTAACLPDPADYAVYSAEIGEFTSYAPLTCSTAGLTTWSVAAAGPSLFFLIVPQSATHEGSYGSGSGGEREPALEACRAQAVGDCPARARASIALPR